MQHLCLPDIQDKVHLAAVCDNVPGRAQAAAEKYGVDRGYDRYEELLADPAVHAITLCTPIGLHFDQAMQALEAGKHIHFNKTMTVTSGEAETLIEEAKRRDLLLVASPGQMIRKVNRKIRRMILDGAIGSLSWAVTGAAFGDYHEQEGVRKGEDVLSNINPSWYWRNPGGGPLYDMTVYGLHTLTGILGPAKQVTAFSGVLVAQREFKGEMYDCDAHDNTVILIDFGNNVFAFAHGTAAGMVSHFGQPSFFGTKGSIAGTSLNGQEIDPELAAGEHPYGPHVTGPHFNMEESHVYEDTMQLVRWIREGVPSPATAEHAMHVIEIIEAAYEAAVSGRTQTLRSTFQTVD